MSELLFGSVVARHHGERGDGGEREVAHSRVLVSVRGDLCTLLVVLVFRVLYGCKTSIHPVLSRLGVSALPVLCCMVHIRFQVIGGGTFLILSSSSEAALY